MGLAVPQGNGMEDETAEASWTRVGRAARRPLRSCAGATRGPCGHHLGLRLPRGRQLRGRRRAWQRWPGGHREARSGSVLKPDAAFLNARPPERPNLRPPRRHQTPHLTPSRTIRDVLLRAVCEAESLLAERTPRSTFAARCCGLRGGQKGTSSAGLTYPTEQGCASQPLEWASDCWLSPRATAGAWLVAAGLVMERAGSGGDH